MEAGLKSEGLLERGNSWYVQWVSPDAASLNTGEFNGVLASWKSKVSEHSSQKMKTAKAKVSTVDLTIGELLRDLKTSQLWSVLAALAAMVAGAFLLGAKLFGAP